MVLFKIIPTSLLSELYENKITRHYFFFCFIKVDFRKFRTPSRASGFDKTLANQGEVINSQPQETVTLTDTEESLPLIINVNIELVFC
jgi:hypothetical protein